MISTLFLFSTLQTVFSNESPIQYDNSDPIVSDHRMMGLVNGIYERNVRRGLEVPNILNDEDRQNILDLHNKIRSETARGLYQGSGTLLPQAANMAELKYSLLLEKVATQWSGYCNFEHRSSGSSSCKSAMASFRSSTPEEWPEYSASAGCGENLYGSGAAPAWISKFGDKDYGIRGGIEDSWCIDEAKTWTFGMSMGSAGHYTQVIWDTSRYVGCGFQECPSSNGWMKNMFTCNYYPAGNGFFGNRNGPYTKGTPCSDCPSDLRECTTGTNAGLCTDNGGGSTPTPRPTNKPIKSPTNNPIKSPTNKPIAQSVPTQSPIKAPTSGPTTPVPTKAPTTKAPTTPKPTQSPVVSGQCIRVDGFVGELNVLNGVYSALGNNWVKGDYKLQSYSGYFGFCTSESTQCPDWYTYGWCQAGSVFECSNIRWGGPAASSSPVITVSVCNGGNNPPPTPEPTSGRSDLGCVKIEQLDINVQVNAVYKTLNDGQWDRMSEDYNGYPCYQWTEGPYYLYTLPSYNWYTISEEIGSMNGLRGWCGAEYGTNVGIFNCNGQWDLGGKDSNSVFRSCNSAGFTFNPCLDDAEEGVCFKKHSNDNASMEFSLYEEEGCLNDQPVYIHTNESDSNFYIHYDAINEMWKISVGKVEENEIYVCANANLLECTENSWIKLIEGFGIQSYEAMATASVEACDVVTDDGSGSEESFDYEIVVIVVMILLCIILIICGFVFYRKNDSKKEVTFNHTSNIEEDKPTDKIPMTNDDIQGDTVNIGTDDEDAQL